MLSDQQKRLYKALDHLHEAHTLVDGVTAELIEAHNPVQHSSLAAQKQITAVEEYLVNEVINRGYGN